MVSQNQVGTDSGEYPTDEHRLVNQWSGDKLDKIKPETMESAQNFAKAASQAGLDEIRDHFIQEIKRLR